MATTSPGHGINEGSGLRTAAEAQAALMLLESLMLTMVDLGVVDKDDLVQAIEFTIATKRAAAGTDEAGELAMASIGMLSEICNSIVAAKQRA